VKIPITSGIFTDATGDYRTSYPVNMVPVAKSTGVSDGYLKPGEGIVLFAETVGEDRGGINVDGSCYRVAGTKLIRVTDAGIQVVLGDVGGTGQVSLCRSFDYLGICSNGNLFLFNLGTQILAQVTDIDLGVSKYATQLGGYFISTDGEFIVTTDLSDPFSVNPLKYGASEVLPDPITSLQVLRDVLYVVNRYGIEQFQNIGGQFFPFQRVDGAYINRGAIGPNACCVFEERLAFIGGGVNEPPAVWLGLNAQTAKISTREIDILLQGFAEEELANVLIESRIDRDQRLLYVHLPTGTMVYDASTSALVGSPIWYKLSSGNDNGGGVYLARNFVWCYDKWIFGNNLDNRLGTFDYMIGSHYGNHVFWTFQTPIVYNESRGALFHELELMCITGVSEDATIWTDYSNDQGVTWSNPKARKIGKYGQREKRINWLQCGNMNERRIQRFSGMSDSHLTISCLEARIEPLS
jgi:hypothetical protein